jgi:hypothetical protein
MNKVREFPIGVSIGALLIGALIVNVYYAAGIVAGAAIYGILSSAGRVP